MTAKSPPPFTALRAIEAAARHRSYTWAAKELAITHSAVSQSIKRLETDLGTKLFERRGTAMEPSAAALQLAQAYADAAGVLRRSLEDVAQAPPVNRLALAMPSDFSRLWLAPRLARLSAVMPDLAVEIRALPADEADDDGSDLRISKTMPIERGWTCEPLTDIALMPVCSPGFAERYHLGVPADVLHVPLIADRNASWGQWLDSAGLEAKLARRGQQFDDAAAMLDAALRGDGLALSQRIFVQQHLGSGALVAPFDHEAGTGERLFVAWRRQSEELPLIGRFMTWLRGEIRLSRKMPAAAK